MIDQKKIAATLPGKLQTGGLTRKGKAVWLEKSINLTGEPGPEEEAFFEKLRIETGE
jgi:hypothetical protein